MKLEPRGEFDKFKDPANSRTCYRMKYKDVKNLDYKCVDREKQPRTIKESYGDVALDILMHDWSLDPILACGDINLAPFEDSDASKQDIDRYVVGNDLKNRRQCSARYA